MSAIRELLNTESSELATVLRYGLAGLRAALDAARLDHPADPGSAACVGVLAELDRLTSRAGSHQTDVEPSSTDSDHPTGEPAGKPTNTAALRELLTRPFAPRWLRDTDTTLPAAELWGPFHLAALRLPELDARDWRRAVAETLNPASLSNSDGMDNHTRWHSLPASTDSSGAILIPPFAGPDGWRTTSGAPVDSDITAALAVSDQSPDPRRAELARLVATIAAMTELDTGLLLGLESVRYKGLGQLDDTMRAAYRRDLLDRLTTYGQARYGSAESFEALLLVDEALHSLLHIPAAAPGSWWADLQGRARALVFHAQRDHPGVQVRLLTQPYRDIRGMTGDNDIRIRQDGSGAVLSCLRLWAEVNGKRLPGRVVYAG